MGATPGHTIARPCWRAASGSLTVWLLTTSYQAEGEIVETPPPLSRTAVRVLCISSYLHVLREHYVSALLRLFASLPARPCRAMCVYKTCVTSEGVILRLSSVSCTSSQQPADLLIFSRCRHLCIIHRCVLTPQCLRWHACRRHIVVAIIAAIAAAV